MGGNGGTKEDMRSTNYGVRSLEKLRPALDPLIMAEATQDYRTSPGTSMMIDSVLIFAARFLLACS